LQNKVLEAIIGGFTTKRAGTYRPFFLVDRFWPSGTRRPSTLHFLAKESELNVALQQIVEQTVAGLGYDLVEIDRSAGGLLRITIDMPWDAGQAEERFVNVEDCEKVTRQLQFALEVEAVEYKRLEVSSPGIDRPLRGEQDFVRFTGEMIDITLKAPMGAAAQGQVSANRKKFRGRLERAEAVLVDGVEGVAGWQIVWSDAPEPKPGQRVSKKRAPVPLQVLGFTLDELRDARLAPLVDFKGRKPSGAPPET